MWFGKESPTWTLHLYRVGWGQVAAAAFSLKRNDSMTVLLRSRKGLKSNCWLTKGGGGGSGLKLLKSPDETVAEL